MKRISNFVSMVLTFALVFSLATPVFAQDVDEPDDSPTVIVVSSDFLNHPIVKLLAGFYSFLFEPPVEDEMVEEPAGDPPVDEGDPVAGDDDDDDETETSETEEDTDVSTVSEEAIASLHQDEKLGFGVITKLLAVLAESKLTCAETGEFCDLTLEMLIEEYQAGMSIGELFAKYGKPELTGVGQVRKAIEPKVKTNSGKKK